MMPKAYRFSRPLTAVFLIFGVAGVAGLVMLAFAPSDLLVPSLALAVIYLLIGSLAAFFAGGKVQIHDRRISIRGSTFGKTLGVDWHDVHRYEFRPASNGYPGAGSWVLATASTERKMPRHLEGYADMQRELLLRLRPEIVVAPREDRVRNSVGNELEIRDESYLDLFFGGIGWLFMVGGMLAWILFGDHKSNWPLLAVFMWFPLLSIGLLGTPAMYQAFRSAGKKELRMDSRRVAYQGHEILWTDLLMFESLLLTSGKGGPTYQVTFVGRKDAFTLHNTKNKIEEIEAFAAAHAPPDAFVLLARLPALQS